MGTPLQTFEGVIWDTGSGTFLIESSDCSNCDTDNPVFQTTTSTSADKSTTHQYTTDPPTIDGVSYLDGTALIGNVGTDRVCPINDEASCTDANFEFIALTEQSGLRSYEDGILGLWYGYD